MSETATAVASALGSSIEPEVGQIYQRGDVQYQILYCDEQIVLLRSSDEGRNTDNTHRIERRVEFEKQVDSGWFEYQPDADLDMMEFEEKDWSEVDYIGAKTNENLHEAGFETALDIQQADDAGLLEVDGLGQKGLANLRRYAR